MRDYLTKKELVKLSWKSVERLQRKKFRAVATALLPHTKAYADLFAKYSINPEKLHCVDDWQKFGLPLFKKKYYVKNPANFVVAPSAENAFSAYKKYLSRLDKVEKLSFTLTTIFCKKNARQLLKTFYQPKMPLFSGGTESGSPTPVFITFQQKKFMEKVIEQIVGVINDMHDFDVDGITGMNLFPYGPHLAWHAANFALEIASDLNLNTAAGGAISTERLAALAATFKPKIFVGMNEYLKNKFFPAVANTKTQMPLRALIINGASKMSDGDRAQLMHSAQRTGIVQPIVLDLYGASELKEDLLAECCPDSGFHHIAPLSTIIRTIKAKTSASDEFIKDWEFTKPEEGGYAAIWTIDGAGSLFEGYLLGDHYEKVSRDKCKHCGLRTERIYNVNRIKDVEAQLALTGIVEQKIKGARINLTGLRDRILSQSFVKEVQLVVGKDDKELLIRFSSQLLSHNALLKMKKFVKDLEVTPKLECVPLDKLSSKMKFEPFVVE